MTTVNHGHPLKGQYLGKRDCHIVQDWILIYVIKDMNLCCIGQDLILICYGEHESVE